MFEPLQAALDAYNSRIAALEELPKKLQEYPNPREEKINLAMHQQAIRDTQTLWEGPPPVIACKPYHFKPDLETIPEATSSIERGNTVEVQLPLEKEPLPEVKPELPTKMENWDEIPEIEEQVAQEMWEAVHRHAEGKLSSDGTPPFSAMDIDNRNHMDDDVKTNTIDQRDRTETLPTYQGECESLPVNKQSTIHEKTYNCGSR